MNKPALFLILVTVFFSCEKVTAPVCNESEGLFERSEFPIGVAINMDEFTANPVCRDIAEKQFNSFTPENIFKADYLHPEEHFFNWSEADSLAQFCQSRKKRLHGHTLIWHQQVPQWIIDFEGNAGQWEQLMKNHIQTIVRHFRGLVAAWDVVNEAFNEDGTLRNSIWREKIGDSYLEKAFMYAREADPEVLLFYNDFNLESNPTKRNSVIRYFNHLRNRGFFLDGIGLQMHVNIGFPEVSQIADAFQQVASNGYKVHVSELDISIDPMGKGILPLREIFEEQAQLLGKIIVNYKQVPAGYRYGITIWGISDKDSWIRSYYNRKDYPLLYDDTYTIKPAYCKLKDVL